MFLILIFSFFPLFVKPFFECRHKDASLRSNVDKLKIWYHSFWNRISNKGWCLHVFISWCVCLLEEFTGASFMCVHITVTILFPVLFFQHQVHRAVINLKIKMDWYKTDSWKFSCQWWHPCPFYWSLWENWHWQAQPGTLARFGAEMLYPKGSVLIQSVF